MRGFILTFGLLMCFQSEVLALHCNKIAKSDGKPTEDQFLAKTRYVLELDKKVFGSWTGTLRPAIGPGKVPASRFSKEITIALMNIPESKLANWRPISKKDYVSMLEDSDNFFFKDYGKENFASRQYLFLLKNPHNKNEFVAIWGHSFGLNSQYIVKLLKYPMETKPNSTYAFIPVQSDAEKYGRTILMMERDYSGQKNGALAVPSDRILDRE